MRSEFLEVNLIWVLLVITVKIFLVVIVIILVAKISNIIEVIQYNLIIESLLKVHLSVLTNEFAMFLKMNYY